MLGIELYVDKYRYYILLLFFLCISTLYPAEILLKQGEMYVVDVISEEAEEIHIRWKGKLYSIPKKHILTIDRAKSGIHDSRKLSKLLLDDGSEIQGTIVENAPDKVTILSSLGYLSIKKKKIKELLNSTDKPELPDEYLDNPGENLKNNLGFFSESGYNTSKKKKKFPIRYGAGILFEPAFAFYSLRPGFFLVYNTSAPKGFQFFETVLYVNKLFNLYKDYNVYINLGGGGSYVKYKKENNDIEGLNPLVYASSGLQSTFFDNVLLRLGLKVTYIHENSLHFANGGLEFLIAYRI